MRFLSVAKSPLSTRHSVLWSQRPGWPGYQLSWLQPGLPSRQVINLSDRMGSVGSIAHVCNKMLKYEGHNQRVQSKQSHTLKNMRIWCFCGSIGMSNDNLKGWHICFLCTSLLVTHVPFPLEKSHPPRTKEQYRVAKSGPKGCGNKQLSHRMLALGKLHRTWFLAIQGAAGSTPTHGKIYGTNL